MAKLLGMSREARDEAIRNENLIAADVTIVEEKYPVRVPGTVGICETASGRSMVYFVDENEKLVNTSVHDTRELANGMIVRRLRKIAADVMNAAAKAMAAPVAAN